MKSRPPLIMSLFKRRSSILHVWISGYLPAALVSIFKLLPNSLTTRFTMMPSTQFFIWCTPTPFNDSNLFLQENRSTPPSGWIPFIRRSWSRCKRMSTLNLRAEKFHTRHSFFLRRGRGLVSFFDLSVRLHFIFAGSAFYRLLKTSQSIQA